MFRHFLQFRIGKNPDYNRETQKCSLSGKQTETSPSIADWVTDKTKFDLFDAKTIVIKEPKISIIFDYPFGEEFKFEFQTDTREGFTREYLIDCICGQYRKMYDEENAACKVSTVEERIGKGGLMNREKTEGPYGIWGHDIDDLYLERITYDERKKTVSLGVGS